MKIQVSLAPFFCTLFLVLVCPVSFLDAMSLHEAAEKGNLERVKELLRVDRICVNDQHPETGTTPLHEACWGGHFALVEFLLEQGAAINAEDFYSLRPLHLACASGQLAMVKLLLEKGACERDGDSTLLHRVCESEIYNPDPNYHVAVLKFLLDERHMSTETETLTGTPVRIASRYGRLDLVRLLVSRRADLKVKDRHGKTPLYAACDERKWPVVRFLISKNAPVCLQEGVQETTSKLCQEALYWETLRQQEPEQEKKDLCEHIKTMATSKTGLLCIWLRTAMAPFLVNKIECYSPEALSTIVRSLFVHMADSCYDLDDTVLFADRLKKLVSTNLWISGFENAPLVFKKAYRSTPRQLFGLLQEEQKCDIELAFS